MDKWISITDKKPPLRESVVICCGLLKDDTIFYYTYRNTVVRIKNKYYVDNSGVPISEYPQYWMPLPKPYNKKI